MKLRIFSLAAILTTTSLTAPAKAENLQHIRQLLSTKECQQCDLSGAGLVLANLESGKLSGAKLSRANLSRANLMGADLSGADLSGASLYGANLTGANLSGANLTGADLRDANITGATLAGVNLTTAFLEGTIGIPQTAGKPDDFYRWAITEAQKGNYRGAIEHFNQALILKPEFAGAYLGRGLARYRLGDERGATTDAQTSAQLFTAQGSSQGFLTAQNFIKGMEEARKPTNPGGGSNIMNFLGVAASVLLRFVVPF